MLLHLANVEIHRLRGWQVHLRKTYYKRNRSAWIFQAHQQVRDAKPIIKAGVERFGAEFFRRTLKSKRLSNPTIVKPVSKTQATSGIKIETGIPISEPAYTGRPKSNIRLAVEALQVGESFLISKADCTSGKIKSIAKSIGIKVACRIVSGINRRTWRTA